MIYGYARDADGPAGVVAQQTSLRAAGAIEVVQDTAGGKLAERAGLIRLLAALAPGDVLLVTRLDRLSHSTIDLLHLLGQIAARQAEFRSLGEPWANMTTEHGGSTAAVIAGLAAFERESLKTRTGLGRQRAIARGVKLGPKFKLSAAQRQDALARLDAGESPSGLARSYRVAVSTITRLRDAAAARQSESTEQGHGQGHDYPQPATARLDSETARATRSFLRCIADKYRPLYAMVYGSRARGTHSADSDADLAVVLDGKPGDRAGVSLDMAGIAVDVLDETGILVSALPLWAVEFERPELFSNPALIRSIRREGLRL